jgi:hypothetical protein
VNLVLGGGLARSVYDPGPTTNTRTGHLGLELIPNQRLSFYLGADRIHERRSGDRNEEGETYLDSSEVSVSWTPVPSIFVFGSYRLERSSQYDDRRLTTTSINWTPFPLGTFRLSLRYDEYYDSLLDSQTRVWGPGLRWYLNPRSYLDVYWEEYESDFRLSQFDRESLTATLRLGF